MCRTAVDGREQVFRQDDGVIPLVTRRSERDSKPANTLGNPAPILLGNIEYHVAVHYSPSEFQQRVR